MTRLVVLICDMSRRETFHSCLVEDGRPSAYHVARRTRKIQSQHHEVFREDIRVGSGRSQNESSHPGVESVCQCPRLSMRQVVILSNAFLVLQSFLTTTGKDALNHPMAFNASIKELRNLDEPEMLIVNLHEFLRFSSLIPSRIH
jgi:hypothetical protein